MTLLANTSWSQRPSPLVRAVDSKVCRPLHAYSSTNTPLPLHTQSTTAVPALPTVTAFLSPSPNPFKENSALTFSLARPGPVALEIFSVDGRRVRSLVQGARDAGEYRMTWDGRNDRGELVGAGVYYARLSTGQGQFRHTVVKLR